MKDWVYLAFSAFLVAASLTLNSVHEAKDVRSSFLQKVSKEPLRVDLNNADLSDLMKLPGIGEKKAIDILNLRETKGEFRTVEEIKEIKGIKNSTLEKIRKYIYVGECDTAN